MKEMNAEEALGRMAAFCSAAEHCRADAREKLRRWGVAEEDVESVITRLEKEKFIDEARYCRAFINDKLRFAGWGKVKIGQALRRKGITPDTYRPLLDGIDPDAYRDTLRKLLAAKRGTLRAASAYELNGKLTRFALGRGYEIEDIRACLPQAEEFHGYDGSDEYDLFE